MFYLCLCLIVTIWLLLAALLKATERIDHLSDEVRNAKDSTR